MQTIKTEHGTYKISDKRDAAEFMRELKKPKRPKWKNKPNHTAQPIYYPMYIPGQTSVREYVRNYFLGNKDLYADDSYFQQYFGHLPSTPASVYDPTQPLVEISHD